MSVDFRLRFPNNISVFVEPGFIAQPSGGNDDVDSEFDPVPTLLVGVGVQF